MDIFKFVNSNSPTLLKQGQIVNGIKNKLWIERYRDFCDFELTANVDKEVHKILTVGSLISHTKTSEVMIVENHNIVDDAGSETEVKITGRSFETDLESRIVGSNKVWPTPASATIEYILYANYTWNQAVRLIKDHISTGFVVDPNDVIPNVEVVTTVTGTSILEERPIKRGELYSRLIEVLNIEDLGIKTMRPGATSVLGSTNPNIAILIHRGYDRSASVVFSNVSGEIESAEYLWSNKKVKNAALITGRWIETVVKDSSTGFYRRMMFVDGTDLDNAFSEAPTGSDRDAVLSAMNILGRAALASQKSVALIKTEAPKNDIIHKYRHDYDLGDIVMVDGEYNETAKMRITEYVEIEDETGESGYPTFSEI